MLSESGNQPILGLGGDSCWFSSSFFFPVLDHRCLLCNTPERAPCVGYMIFFFASYAGAVVLTVFCDWGEAWAGQVSHLPGRKVDAVRDVDLSGTVVCASPDSVTS